MIPEILGLFFAITSLRTVYGAAYSQVYVQRGAEVVPVEYVKYGAPTVVTNGQIAALSAPPVGSALPLPNVVSPCVAPCIIAGQSVGAFAPPQNSKIVYNAPSAPAVVIPTNDDKSGYEYSYVVYDEDTGDRKAQRELSDGSVVHGEYSFIQPDGYVREVKYTADDLTGFNAVVKSFLPESVFGTDKKKPEAKENSAPKPCEEPKSEALKNEPTHEAQAKPQPSDTNKPDVEAHVELLVKPVDHSATEHVADTGEKPSVQDNVELPAGHSGETLAEHAAEQVSTTPAEHTPENIETPHKAVAANPTPSSPVEVIQTHTQNDCDQKTHADVQAPNPQVTVPNGLATYSDIVRCIQSSMANKDGNAPNISPLTYIILNGANKPC